MEILAKTVLIAIALSGMLFAAAGQWTGIGPEGGHVQSLAADPQHPSTIYAATCGGVFKSVDAGTNWAALTSAPPALDCIGLLAVDPQNAGMLYAASCSGIFKTTDAGTNWIAIKSRDPLGDCFVSLAIDSQNPGTLYAGASGIFKTTDGGSSWTRVNPAFLSDRISILAVDPQNSGTVYAAGYTYNGLFKSIDGGASWNSADSGLPPPPNGGQPLVGAFAIDPQTSGTLYAASRGRIFKSTDGGAAWSDASLGLPSAPAPLAGSNRVLSLVVDPQTPAVIYGLMARNSYTALPDFFLVVSTDGAASWTTAALPVPSVDLDPASGLTPAPQTPGTLYLGTNNGVLKTTDAGGHWNSANSGLRALPVGSVVIDSQSGTLLAAKAAQLTSSAPALYKSADGGNSWLPSGFGSVSSLVSHPQDPARSYVLASNGGGYGLFQSGNDGASWAEIWTNTNPSNWVFPLVIYPQNPNIMYAGVNSCNGSCYPRISKSINGGYTWTESRFSLNGSGCCSSISSVAVDPQNPDIVYAGAGDGDTLIGSGLWKSQDGGVSWVKLISGNIDFITIDPRNSGTIYVNDSKSTDGGQTFTPGCGGILVIDPQNSDTLYCAANNYGSRYPSVLRSTDAGANWTVVGSGLTGVIVSLAIDPQNPATLYAATTGGLFVINVAQALSPANRLTEYH